MPDNSDAAPAAASQQGRHTESDLTPVALPSTALRPKSYDGPYPALFNKLPAKQQADLLELFERMDRLPNGLSITVGNLKGGVSKTTTAVFLALLLGIKGDSVLLVDCDSVNKSSFLWSMSEDWPKHVRVVCWAGEDSTGKEITGRMMADRVRKKRGEYRHVIIDTGPQMKEYVQGGLRETNVFIICSSPFPMDTVQIKPSVDLASDVEAMKDGPIYPKVLLSRAVKNTKVLRDARRDLAKKETECFETAITSLLDYALTVGSVPTDFLEYVDVLRELVDDELSDLDNDAVPTAEETD